MQVQDRPTLPSYTRLVAMTSAGRYAPLLDTLPRDIAGLATVAHGLLVHEDLASAYGLSLTNEGGYWWIATHLMRDAAALRNIELRAVAIS